jgi:hypothetical protein
MCQPSRLLLTGSRTWADDLAIERALALVLARHPPGVLLVHGDCLREADAIAARTPGYLAEAHPADWQRYGRAAGHRRNAEMIVLGADGCLVFLRGASHGTTATMHAARAAGIPIWLHTRS